MAIIVTGLLAQVLNILTMVLAIVDGIPGADGAAVEIKNAILSVTQAISILNLLPPITIP